jgi:hypothetical protein
MKTNGERMSPARRDLSLSNPRTPSCAASEFPGETQGDSPRAVRGSRAEANVIALRDQALRAHRRDRCMLRLKGKPHPAWQLLPRGIDSPVELRLDSLPLIGAYPIVAARKPRDSFHTW